MYLLIFLVTQFSPVKNKYVYNLSSKTFAFVLVEIVFIFDI